MTPFYKHLKGVLTPEECDRIIAIGNEHGFAEAPITMRDGSQQMFKDVRNNDRVTFHDMLMALELTETIIGEIPKEFKDAKYVKLGSFFRLYRYVPGQYFKPHYDGSFDAGDCASEITVLFYLNDTDGGETVLRPRRAAPRDEWIVIEPKKGDVLMFEHHILHEGKEVNSGKKFVLRTDVFYA